MDFGKQLKNYRLIRKLSQEEIASRAGLNEKYYGRLERNESNPTINMLEKICNALGIGVAEFFACNFDAVDSDVYFEPKLVDIILKGLRNRIDIHVNRDILLDGCEQTIWYNGYIGSMHFDEFELQIFANGNIKGQLFKNYKEVLNLNSEDISNELKKYIDDDKHLDEVIEYMPTDEEVLKDKSGNAFFVSESNWLMARLINNTTGEVVHDDIILDADNIISVFKEYEVFMDYIFE